MWSCRFWASYVVLYFVQLYKEWEIVQAKQKDLNIKISRAVSGTKIEKEDLKRELAQLNKERKSLTLSAIINGAYFPLTLHWSVESPPLPDLGVGICGAIAAVTQAYTTWKAFE
jgi:hypothetical protein